MIRALKLMLFIVFYVVTVVPGITLMCISLGDFDYLTIGEAVQAWAEK